MIVKLAESGISKCGEKHGGRISFSDRKVTFEWRFIIFAWYSKTRMRKKRRIRAGVLAFSILVALAVWGAILAAREISATLNDIVVCGYTLETSEPALSAAFLAAYK